MSLRHCGQILFPSSSLFMGIMNILSPIAVPTFFAVSGFLFFIKKRNVSDLWKYVWRVAKLYLIWTLIYLPFIACEYYSRNMVNINGIIDFLKNFFFSGSYFHLWFLPALFVAIVLVFCGSKRLSDRSMIILSIVLFVIGTLVDTYSSLSSMLTWSGYKAIFITTRNGVFFGLPFVVIGKLVAERRYEPKISALIVSLILLLIEGVYLTTVLNKDVVNMSLSSIIVVPTILIFVLNRPSPQIDSKEYRKMSTLIFCSHPIAIFFVGHFLKGYVGTAGVLIITLFADYAIVKMAKKFKLLENLW